MPKQASSVQLPMFEPTSGWKAPTALPDLRGQRFALDTETRDVRLSLGYGPGWRFSEGGHICGISYAGKDQVGYVPIRHPETECFDKEAVARWLADHLRHEGTTIIFHNASYDLGWIRHEFGLTPRDWQAKIEDTSLAAVIVNENRLRYSLDACCEWRRIPGKDDSGLVTAAETYGFKTQKEIKANLWQLPARHVGPYAQADAAATLALAKDLDPDIDRDGLRAAYQLELDLVPMVHEMRWRGIRVDVAAAEAAAQELERRRDEVFTDISEKLGTTVGMDEIGRNRWLEATFDKLNIEYPRTSKGNASFTSGQNGWMDSHPHWLPQAIVKADKLNNAANKFVRTFILQYASKGRIHPSINQIRGEDGGTRTTRFSYSDPALQQMPSRDNVIAPLIRGCFLPEEGAFWVKPDFSQQEVRLIVHFAELLKLEKAFEAGEEFRKNPRTDYHQMVADMTGLPRPLAKNVNFAKAYGAGVEKFALMAKIEKTDAERIVRQYDTKLPFVSGLANEAKRYAGERGYIKLIDGARIRYDKWELSYRPKGEPSSYVWGTEEDAKAKWPGRRVVRADTRKAGNALIQGSAARQTKLAMREIWKEGVVPLLQLHDEIDISVETEAEALRVKEIMCNVVKLTVPVEVDLAYGRSWGDAKHQWSEL